MNPMEYLTAFRRKWFVIVAAGVVGAAAGWFAAPAFEPEIQTHRATATLFTSGAAKASKENLQRWSALIVLDPVVSRVVDVTGYSGGPSQLTSRVQTEVQPNAGILYVTATSTDAREARYLADTFAEELVGYVKSRSGQAIRTRQAQDLLAQIAEMEDEIARLDARIENAPSGRVGVLTSQRNRRIFLRDALSSRYATLVEGFLTGPSLEVIQEAALQEPESGAFGVGDSRSAWAALAGLLGLLVGAGLALVAGQFDRRIHTKEAAEAHFHLPVLTEIPVIPRRSRRQVIASTEPTSPTAEAFRLLGAEVVRGFSPNGDAPKTPHTILVTSAAHAEGKTTVVANLAVACADMGKSVMVVSCDFRRPRIHRVFGIPNDQGLADALKAADGKPILDGYTWDTAFADIHVVPSGTSPERPSELLTSQGMRQALDEARGAAQVVLLDAPPILVASDAAHLLPEVDAVIVVARAGTTRAELAERTTTLLRRLGAPLVGVTLNGARVTRLPGGHRQEEMV